MITKTKIEDLLRRFHKEDVSKFPYYKEHFPTGRCITEDINYRTVEFNKILSFVQKHKSIAGNTVLDIGTGYGQIPFLFNEFGNRVYCIDDDYNGSNTSLNEKEPFTFASKFYTCLEKGVFPFETEKFDIITCLNTIEHIQHSPKAFLSEIYRILKKDGLLFISNPNLSELGKRVSFSFLGKSPLWEISDYFQTSPDLFVGHNREFTNKELQYMANSLGFNVIGYGYYDLEYYKWRARNSNYSTIRKFIEKYLYFPLRSIFPTLRSQTYIVCTK